MIRKESGEGGRLGREAQDMDACRGLGDELELLACGLLLWSWHVATVGSGFWQLLGSTVLCCISSSLHCSVQADRAGRSLGVVCHLYFLGENRRRNPVSVAQHLLGPSLSGF